MDTKDASNLLYINMFDKNYICVCRTEYHIEPQWTSKHIYIGQQWETVEYPDGPPMMIARDFKDFKRQVEEKYGSMKKLFENLETGKLKIFTETKYLGWFLMYFTNQMAQVYKWTDDMIATYLNKQAERLWIWDGQKVPVDLKAYKKYAEKIPKKDLLFTKDNLTSLPFEALLLMWANNKMKNVGETEIMAKVLGLKDYFVNMSVRESIREAKTVVFTCPQVLKKFRNFDITGKTMTEVLNFLEKDELFHYLFFAEEKKGNIDFIEQHIDDIVEFFGLVQEYDLDKTDPFPAYNELQFINKLFFKDPEKTFKGILDGTETVSLHELKFFREYEYKINSHMVAWIVVNHIEKDYYDKK